MDLFVAFALMCRLFLQTYNNITSLLQPEIKKAATDDLLDLASTKKAAAVVSTASAGAASKPKTSFGGYVPPTPPVRKRLTRQSPGPDLRKTKYLPAPQSTGPDNVSVLWVNDVFQWLYNDLVILNELLQVWIQSLNEYSRKSVAEVR